MYDYWVESAENGDLTALCMLNISAAFDVVDHSILLQKLKLYGCHGCHVTSQIGNRVSPLMAICPNH